MSQSNEAYCVKCRTKREIKDPQVVDQGNGRRAMKGKCPVCGTNMTKFLPGEKKQ